MITKKVIPYDDIDEPIRDLCRYINRFDGIETVESCCGHGIDKCRIWCHAKDMPSFIRFLNTAMNHETKWSVLIDTYWQSEYPDSAWLMFYIESDKIDAEKDIEYLTQKIKEASEVES